MKRFFEVLVMVFVISLSIGLFTVSSAYNEAPMLEEKVTNGELPSVKERLPEDPMVIEPVDQIGEYGGTWERLSTSEDWLHFTRMAMDGPSIGRYTSDVMKTVPHLVKEWEYNEDISSFTFYFRKGLKWSDGEPVTVDDFIYWWEDMATNSEHSMAVPEWTKAEGKKMEVTKVDDYTLKLDFVAPNPFLLDNISMWSSMPFNTQIWPSHYLKQFHPDYNEEYSNFEVLEEKEEWWHNFDCPVLTAWKPVEEELGERLILERNPYYYAVDSEGNQLPYIDRVKLKYVSDAEIYKLQISKGESDMQIRPKLLSPRDVSLLKRNEEEYNFKALLWGSGSGTGSSYQFNYNHPDPDKKELYRNPQFKKALSHAINRGRIKRMVYYEEGYETTGTYSPDTPIFKRTEAGKEMFEKWRDSAVEFNPEKAKEILDEIGVVDQNENGWRDMPNGEELVVRIDMDPEGLAEYSDSTEMVKEDWRAIDIKTIVNTVDGSKLGVMMNEATFDVRNSWEIGDGSSIIGQPEWAVPVANQRWAPLNGAWFMVGTEQGEEELDKDPRDRTPPRERPEEGSAVDRLQKIYEKAKVTPDIDEREQLAFDIINIHIEEGPFVIGTVADWSRVGVIKNNFKNVPEKIGMINDWHLGMIGALNPEQFYIEE